MAKLIFDIETVGESFEAMDATTQGVLTRWIRKESDSDDEYAAALKDLKDGLGFSPLTGRIVAIGTLDAESGRGGVYFQAGQEEAEFEEGGLRFKPLDESGMLRKFWEIAERYDEFVSFNGRGFDVPFLEIRSAVHKLRPSKDLMSNRYLGSQKAGAKHVDLLDQLSFYGAVRRKGNLHLWCRAFGIKSPKSEGLSGDDVAGLFRAARFREIARYNAGDLKATRELYEYWNKYIRF